MLQIHIDAYVFFSWFHAFLVFAQENYIATPLIHVTTHPLLFSASTSCCFDRLLIKDKQSTLNLQIKFTICHDMLLSICCMDTIYSTVIGTNVKELRDAIGLSQHYFSLLFGASRTTLTNLESGNMESKTSLLESILAFTGLAMEALSKEDFRPPDNIREELTERYKHEPAIYVILSAEPTIAYGIKYRLLKTNFLDTPKETKQIRQFFEDIGWKFKGNSLHIALKRMPELIEIRPHPTKKRTNVYVRRKKR